MPGERIRGREFIGKVVVSKDTGKRFGVVSDIAFVTESGELMNLIISDPTVSAAELGLQEDDKGRLLIPFSAVRSAGDFVIIDEKDII
jgi:sporulation protein YlmC with PRC-barrel domain